MSSTSQKQREFAREPMGKKGVSKFAGIGPVLAKRFQERGFEKAHNVLGQYLILNKDKESFCNWVEDVTKANRKQSNDCFNCLNEWCDAFFQ